MRPGFARQANTSCHRTQDIFEVYSKVLAGYVPRYYPGRVALLWPVEAPISGRGDAASSWDKAADPTLGWSKLASEVEVHKIPGGMLTSLTRYVDVLAGQMKDCLEKAWTGDENTMGHKWCRRDSGDVIGPDVLTQLKD